MRTIYLNSKDPYIIGKTGESQKTALRVDVEEWYQDYPSGAGALLFVRPNKVTYPLETTLVEHEGKHYLETIVTTNETKLPGWVVITAQWYDGETLLHGRTYSGKVLTSNGTNVTDGVQETTPTWVAELIDGIQAINETAATVQEAYDNMQHAVEMIDTAVQTAQQTVTQAEEYAGAAAADAASALTYKNAAATSATSAAASAEQAMTDTPDGYSTFVGSMASAYSPASGYAVGDYALKDGQLYRCKVAIEDEGETWTAAHWTAVDVSSELSALKNSFDNKIETSKLELVDSATFPLEVAEIISNKYPSGNVGSAVAFVSSETNTTVKYRIPAGATGVYPTLSKLLNSFTRVTDSDGIVLTSGKTGNTGYGDTARFIYICANGTTTPEILDPELLMWTGETDQFVHATESTLYHPVYKAFYKDLMKPVSYQELHDAPEEFLTKEDFDPLSFSLSSSATIVPVCTFVSNEANVSIEMTLTATITSGILNVRVQYKDDNDTWKNAASDGVIALEEGEQDIVLNVDCASLIQYQSAQNFRVIFARATGESTGSVVISEARGVIRSNLSTYEGYNKEFIPMMSSVMGRLEAVERREVSNFLVAPNGSKYGLAVTNDGTLTTYPVVPNKILFMGNSIVFGLQNEAQTERFGMAATRADYDFANQVAAYTQEVNPNVEISKLYTSPFAHCETLADARQFMQDNLSYFTEDVNLIIIMIGDNVNTNAKRDVFKDSFPELIQLLKTRCPHARIMMVGIWFNHSVVFNIMTSTAQKYGCQFVDIRSIRSPETEGELGATVYFEDGTTTTITEARVTHPGNLGMQKIAEAIEAELGY